MRYSLSEETIAAIATAPGEGAIAIVRMSGSEAIAIAKKVFRAMGAGELVHQKALPGWVVDEDDRRVDQVVAVTFKGPASFTGEDIVEFHTHGGWIVPRQVLEVLIRAGARLALPGEFSSRAVLNEKMDLAQAEAIQSLIGARNERATRVAQEQLGGRLSRHLKEVMRTLCDLAGILEAWVDFPEEDLEFASFDEVARSIEEACGELKGLLRTYQAGRKVRSGVRVCLAGAPNVGKSSLMNALLGRDRAIVTDIAGTTRDLLESEWRIAGLHVTLVDTAGVRQTDEVIEAEGIRRSRQAMQEADLVLVVLDLSRAFSQEEELLLEGFTPGKSLLVWNKVDMTSAGDGSHVMLCRFPHQVMLSAKTGEGMAHLHMRLEQIVQEDLACLDEELMLTEERHAQLIGEACSCLEKVIQGLSGGVSAEYVSMDMRCALQAIGSITGDHVAESVLSAIFSRFCLGK